MIIENSVTMAVFLHEHYTGHSPFSEVYLAYITFRKLDLFPSSGVSITTTSHLKTGVAKLQNVIYNTYI
jgi:hypothetical protein